MQNISSNHRLIRHIIQEYVAYYYTETKFSGTIKVDERLSYDGYTINIDDTSGAGNYATFRLRIDGYAGLNGGNIEYARASLSYYDSASQENIIDFSSTKHYWMGQSLALDTTSSKRYKQIGRAHV